jgi:hypothetical protein
LGEILSPIDTPCNKIDSSNDSNTNGDKDNNTNGDKDNNTNGDKDSNTNGDKDNNTNGDNDSNTNGDKDINVRLNVDKDNVNIETISGSDNEIKDSQDSNNSNNQGNNDIIGESKVSSIEAFPKGSVIVTVDVNFLVMVS